ncbi:MAG: thiamine-phosphate kinase [Desulfobacterales bacterium]|nr:thiamine-phosphate kinase [Desulfobacterales bacterium]
MKIKEIGGEFALIQRLSDIVSTTRPEVIQGIGDDAAVVRVAPEPAPYLLVTTDILVEEQHFKRAWASAAQIGIKAAECNVSDIAAMGGTPQWMFVSLVLPVDTEVAWAEELYRGLDRSCRRHNIALLGGDTTQGALVTINITLLGSVSSDHLRLRSHARPGDALLVTGCLGASAAALALFSSGHSPSAYLREKHLAPSCRLDVAGRIAPLAHAMIDISDGLGSEVGHICKASRTGAEILASAVPLHDDVREAGRLLGVDPLRWAIGGGEDFELLFSMPPENIPRLKASGVTCYEVGRVTDRPGDVVLVSDDGTVAPLGGGYNHFK